MAEINNIDDKELINPEDTAVNPNDTELDSVSPNDETPNTENSQEQVSEMDIDQKSEQNNDAQISLEDEKSKKIDELTKQAEQMKDLAQRTQAEFMNYKKRTAKEMQDITVFANEKIMSDLITVLDNFERAISIEENKDDPLYKGVELIQKQLIDTLKKYGLQDIEAKDQPFDPNFHHAVMQEEADTPGMVLEVLQKGYKLKDKVLRAAMVKVSN
ncbi:nucleotide exchange factor GrpE [Criibacterium bergeronii]|uniref:Protein GrpE n=1 Tax=Criibacterium bergeronii TaxID=1871336 RepID=A0A371INK9_9FIRM|nr:nucleotide exchange factor GrpE [Criibacterium bergeronii]MBS6063640.1 nucleotide exchange factor GrpE [Peptostreptococcaceae bacterium]RDY22081.1 nucleotide exchange factor GrpE [Criibacterium bergeronii]